MILKQAKGEFFVVVFFARQVNVLALVRGRELRSSVECQTNLKCKQTMRDDTHASVNELPG